MVEKENDSYSSDSKEPAEIKTALPSDNAAETGAPSESENGLAGSAISEARATLASIAAQMAERNGQPMQVRQINPLAYSPHPTAIYADSPESQGEPDASATDLNQRANHQNRQTAGTASSAASNAGASETAASTSAGSLAGQTSKASSPPTYIRSSPRSHAPWVVGVALCSIISALIGIYLGSKFRLEHKVISGLLPPAKDAGFGRGKPIMPQSGDNVVADIVARVLPTVVDVEEEIAVPTDRDGLLSNLQQKLTDSGTVRRSLGTGLIVRSDGYIITNSHVTRKVDKILVVLNDKRSFPARLVGKDTFTDLSLLKIEASDLPVARFGDSSAVRTGDWAIAIGSPLGYDHTVTLGIISAQSRNIADLNNHVDLIQTDAAMNPGNSGGPLLNIKGEVVGVNTLVRANAQNIGFAVPINAVREVANALMEHGSLKRPYLGIFMQDLTPYLIKALGLKAKEGVLVSHLVPLSPCQKAGIGTGDVILQVEGHPVLSVADVRAIVKQHASGDVVDFIILTKAGDQERRKVRIGEYPEE